MKKTLLFIAVVILCLKCIAQNTDSRVFELRTYYAADGKLDALIERFQNHTLKLFRKHRMENIGYWTPTSNDKNLLTYILAYPSIEARETSWKAFQADAKWKKVRTKSELNGKLLNSVTSVFMKAADFSPQISSSKKGNRVFEISSYNMAPGKVNDLLSRFRNYPTSLFVKHGATNIDYWTTIEKGTIEPKLIYILAHNNEETARKTLENLLSDSEWIKVKNESERNGKLVEKVESVYLNALPFSNIK